MLLLGLLAPLAAVAARPFGIDWDKAYSPTSEPLMWNKVTYVKDGKLAASPGRTSIVPFWWWGAMRLGSHVGARSSFLGGPFGTSNFGSMGPFPSMESLGARALMWNAAGHLEDDARKLDPARTGTLPMAPAPR